MNDSEFLLQRLQELKAWQAEQEERLLREQEDQMDQLYMATAGVQPGSNVQDLVVARNVAPPGGGPKNQPVMDNDDASTIDQDISSLADDNDVGEVRSLPPPPAWAQGEESSPPKPVNNGSPTPPVAKTPTNHPDDIPIKAGNQANMRTFEELLSQELRVNRDAVKTPEVEAQPAEPSPPLIAARQTSSAKPFLRRGSGLARYGGVKGSPEGVVRRIHSSGKIHTRNFSKSSTNLAAKTPPQGQNGSGVPHQPTLKPSSSCSKINSMSASAMPSLSSKKNSPASSSKPSPPTTSKQPVKSALKQPQKTLRLKPSATGNNVEEPLRKKLGKSQHGATSGKMSAPSGGGAVGAYDSVELSFMEKLDKADKSHKKEMEDLAVFEMLEEAACDSSFCSNSSAVKKLIDETQQKMSPQTTSTPKAQLPNGPTGRSKAVSDLRPTNLSAEFDDVAIEATADDERLMKDIQAFLTSKGATVQVTQNQGQARKTDAADNEISDDEDDTLKDFGSDDMEDNNHRVPLGDQGGSEGEEEEEEGWSDVDDECLNNQARPTARPSQKHHSGNNNPRSKNVRFSKHQSVEEFSPPRMPKNSPSYLIWSIFTKEREERLKRGASKNGEDPSETDPSPRSSRESAKQVYQDNLQNNNGGLSVESGFQSALLNAKLIELEKEIDHFRKENEALKTQRRKLNTDKKQLAKEITDFERVKESDKKKLEEEKKRLRRDRALLDKAQKDKRSNQDKKSQDEIEDLQAKVSKVTEELERKECKWANALNKLQDQLKFLEKENQTLHEENHKLKLKGIAPKISTRLVDPAKKMVGNLSYEGKGTGGSGDTIRSSATNTAMSASSPAGGATNFAQSLAKPQRPHEDEALEVIGDPANLADVDGTAAPESLPPITPRMEAFSPAESLESNVTLVSAGLVTTSEAVTTVREESTRNSKSTYSLPKSVTKKNSTTAKGPASNTTEKTYPDGRKEICYANGNRKEVSGDGKTTRVLYYNGDVKESFAPSGLVKYFYSQTKTWHLTYPDGKEVLQFSNGQEEVRYPSGVMEISFSDGSVKKISSDGSEDIKFPDGTHVVVEANGDRTLNLANGQKEIHTAQFKRREYPDGTVKILYEDGRQETQYSSGRTRIKDRTGKLIHDSMTASSTSDQHLTATPT